MWWDHIPDANCKKVKEEHCSVDAAPGGHVMPRFSNGFNRPGGSVMLIMLFTIW